MPSLLFASRNVVWPAGRERPRARGVHGEVHFVTSRLLQEVIGLQELHFGFSGEADNDVRGDRGLRHPFASELDAIKPIVATVRPSHSAKNVVIASLGRKVHVLANRGEIGPRPNNLVRHVLRVRSQKTKSVEPGYGIHSSQQVCETGPLWKVMSVG